MSRTLLSDIILIQSSLEIVCSSQELELLWRLQQHMNQLIQSEWVYIQRLNDQCKNKRRNLKTSISLSLIQKQKVSLRTELRVGSDWLILSQIGTLSFKSKDRKRRLVHQSNGRLSLNSQQNTSKENISLMFLLKNG